MASLRELEMLKAYLGRDVGPAADDLGLLNLLLDAAGETILEYLYPYGTPDTGVPERYLMKQIQIAAYYFNMLGVEGQVVHAENGTRREYERAGIPRSMLEGLTPHVGVPR